MPTLTLYHMPGACSRVTMHALEETGVAFEDKAVALLRGAQREPAYLAINPKGKVPVLLVDGAPITENPAILYHLAEAYPAARLLPGDRLRGLSDLIWCGGTLHPLSHRFFRPGAYTDPSGEPAVKAIAMRQLHDAAAVIAARVADGGWWYGDDWSIVDTYLAWIFGTAAAFGFPGADYPELVAHGARVAARPAFERARQREIAAVARDDLAMVPGIIL